MPSDSPSAVSSGAATTSMVRRSPFALLLVAAVSGLVFASVMWIASRWHRAPSLLEIRTLADRGLWQDAELQMAKYLAKRRDDDDALVLAARIAAGGGDLERCAQLLRSVPTGSPLKFEALLREGQSLRELGYGRRAELVWRELTDLARNRAGDAPRYTMLARTELVALLSLEGRLAECRELLWLLYPGHREPWRILVNIARLEGQAVYPQTAMGLLEECVARDAEDLDARRGLARYLISLSRWEEAASQAQYCHDREPGKLDTLEILIECRQQLHEWDAVEQLIDAVDWTNATPRLLALRGKWHEMQGRLDQAEQDVRASLTKHPHDPTVHFQLAQLLRRTGSEDFEKHHSEFRRLSDCRDAINAILVQYTSTDPTTWGPPEPETCVVLGENCAGLGRLREARAWFEFALRQEPKLESAKRLLDEIPAVDD